MRAHAIAARVPAQVFGEAAIVEIVSAAEHWLKQHSAAQAAAYRAAADALIVDFELAAATDADPFEACRPLLAALRRGNRRIAIVTRNCRAAVLEVLPEVDRLVDVLLTRDDVTRLKPDPAHLHDAFRAVGATARQAVLVGDGQMDMRMGRSANTLCIGVLSGSSGQGALFDAGADFVLNDIAELLPLQLPSP